MMFRSILVAVDGSRESDKAVDIATDMALKLGAKIVFLHVVNVPDVGQVPLASGNIEKTLRGALTETGKKVLEKATEVARRKGVSATQKISEGNPAMTIVKEASNLGADLIVMGSKGATGVERILLGSTAEKVLRWSSVPVLVAKE
jgi:nucleotide-binding universal stress UspA family protein